MLEMIEKHLPAILALADGTVFHGIAIGATDKTALGEVVFNTAMSGYQEILTDPSYAEQIITFTYPHIGNVGINADDMESKKIYAPGVIIANASPIISNWRAQITLDAFLKKNNTVGISAIDTRCLTRILREKGAQNGYIMSGDINIDHAIRLAREHSSLEGKDLAKKVSTKKSYVFSQKTYQLPLKYETPTQKYSTKNVIVLDFGVKHQTLKLLNDRHCTVTVVPAKTTATDILKLKPDGVLLSNGPGDPAACDYAISCVKTLLEKNVPLFGICLGCQILALACGAQTFKMKFGHHGSNHPVQNLKTKLVSITSQNHGFAIKESTLPSILQITHRSLFDQTIQGIKHATKDAIGFQGHPEASPGPHDIEYLFDEFMEMMHAQTN